MLEAKHNLDSTIVDIAQAPSQAAVPSKEIVELVVPTWRVVVLSIRYVDETPLATNARLERGTI